MVVQKAIPHINKRNRIKPVKDNFSKAMHRLMYVWWSADVPGSEQEKEQLRMNF